MSSIKLFESKQIRSEWSGSEQKWYFAVIDVVEILTESQNPRRYWSDLKRKLNAEGFSQLYEIIVQLKMISPDGKKYLTDCADSKGFLRINHFLKTDLPLLHCSKLRWKSFCPCCIAASFVEN